MSQTTQIDCHALSTSVPHTLCMHHNFLSKPCPQAIPVVIMLKSPNNHESVCLQAARLDSSLTKLNSAEGSKLSAAGLATHGSADSSLQASIKAEPGNKAEDTSAAVSSALPSSVSAGVKQEAAAALPMEVDDDAMFQKPSRAVKPDPSEVGCSVCHYDKSAQ